MRLLAELQFELWIGDAAQIRAKRVSKQKTDRQDAQHMLTLLIENHFPQIWVTELGESGPAAVTLAPTSHGTDAHSPNESIAGRGSQ